MNNRKKIIIAIIILLFIGLTIFAFASGKGSGDDDDNINATTNTNKVVDNTTDDGKTNNTTNSNTNNGQTNNATNNNVNNTTNNDQASNTTTDNQTNNSSANESNTNEQTTKEDDTANETDDSYEKALEAVVKAEKALDQDSYDSAKTLVDKVTDDNKKSELESRLEKVADAIETKELTQELADMVDAAESKEDIEEARNFANENEVSDKVSNLTNEELKEELTQTLNELSSILDDVTAPEINIEDEAILNVDTAIQITDDNDFEAALTKDGEEVPFENGDTVSDGKYSLTVVDEAFNETTINFTIDTIAPEGVISYSKTVPTNEDVVATLSVSEEVQDIEGWTRQDETTFTKTYSDNTTEEVTIVDLANNSGKVTVEVTNIDRVLPQVVSFEIEALSSNGPMVKAIVTFDKKVTISDNTWSSDDSLIYTSTFTMSQEGIITFTDEAGNTNTYSYSIDATAPTVEVTYSPESATNQEVTVTIASDEDLQDIEGWTKIDSKTFTKVYEENTSENVIVKDLIGNSATAEVSIDFIDKTAPSVTATYSTTDLTNTDVTATITSDEDLQDIEGWTKVSATEFNKVYSENTTETINVLDIVGNSSTVEISIENIDKIAPVITISYSETNPTNSDVVATITSDKDLQDIEGYTKVDAKTFTKTYEENVTEIIEVKDLAGNTASANIEITNIDKTAPEVQSITQVYNSRTRYVRVTLEFNENVTISTSGWTKVSDTEYYAEFRSSSQRTVNFADAVGNTNTYTFTSDTTAPTLNVSYSTTELTNQDVTVTLTANEDLKDIEGWTKVDSKTFTKAYSSNVNESVTATDLAGISSSVRIRITNIDKIAPTATVSYSTTEMTNGSVTVTISATEDLKNIDGWNRVNARKYTKEYTNNINEEVTVYDIAGNSAIANIEITNIDNTIPEVSVSYSTTELTSGSVVATITSNEELQSISGWTLDNSQGYKYIKEYTENASETVTVYDLAGNSTSVNIEITNIDNTAPVISVSYSTTQVTDDAVVATITSDEDLQDISGWTKVDGKTFTKEYNDNTSETVTVYDKAGNSATADIEISNIDKVAPELSVTYSKTELTNEDVTVTIAANEDLQIIEGWTKVDGKTFTKVYSENGGETVIAYDLIGNSSSIDIAVENIDKVAPVITISYSETELTNQDVTATITSNEELQAISGWITNDNITYTKVFDGNVNETVTVYDIAGNSASENVIIENIDKVAPNITVSYSETNLTNQDVTATITSDKDLQDISGWSKVDSKTFTKVYTENASEQVTVYDLIGNSASANIEITNIDKIAPEVSSINEVVTVSYRKTDKVTLTFSEAVTITSSGWTKVNDTEYYQNFTNGSSVTVNFVDVAGNTNTYRFNPDFTSPTLSISYSTISQTSGPVTATITGNEDLQDIEGWTRVDARTFTKEYTSNTTTTVYAKDLAGNQSSVRVRINNIH